VRHNEDILNAQLAQNLPWLLTNTHTHTNANAINNTNTDTNINREVGDDEDFGDSNLKAYLLLQAHFVRLPLPISDYITDTKTVLDNAPRVLNAMLDIAAELGLLSMALHITLLSQMIIQGIFPLHKGCY